MSVPVQPFPEYVVVQAEAAQTKTASGLYLPSGSAEKPKVAKIVAVGSAVKEVKVGDRVLYKNEYESTNVKVGSEEYVIVYYKNLVATLK